MDMAGPEADMPMPISSNYGGIHEQVKLRFVGSGNGTPTEEIRSSSQDQGKSKKNVRYRECQKNHAASIGGHAIDGCGEFMPSGEEGTLDSLRCAACDCHRNFHRREVEGESSCGDCPHARRDKKRLAPQLILPPGAPGIIHSGGPVASRAPGSGAILMPYGSAMSESEEHEGGYMPSPPSSKKRFRTKFTQDQKDKMLVFAEKLGWKIQKHDEADVQQFCSETGVKRHVLKVWMHNNKNTLGKKN